MSARLKRWLCRAAVLVGGLGLSPLAAQAVGVTVITHGFGGDVNGWVTAMADRIPHYHFFPGTNFTTYTITLTTDGSGNYFYQWQRTNGTPPSASDSGEIIVKLDWSQLAALTYVTSTYRVASIADRALLDANFIPELGGHALAEFPLHLIGHSRGGSLIAEMSRQLGTNGLWIDHLTTLDPHPVNNDGFSDPFVPTTDAPVHTYANILFHDNYWEDISLYPDGESVAGAYIRPLNSSLSTDPSGGYGNYHSDVHLWYHGTIDWNTPASYSYPNDSATIDATMRAGWWVGYEANGAHAGFLYSLMGGANRLSTDQPLGPGFSEIRDGFNQAWDLGAGAVNNRTALPANNGTWPNLIRCNRTATNAITQGQSMSLRLYYQWAAPAASNATVIFFLDNDLNPLDANQVPLTQSTLPATGSGTVGTTTISVPLYATNAAPGWYWVYARISGGGKTRHLYAPERVQVLSGVTPPTLDIAALSPVQFRIGITGQTGQTIILQASPDLLNWLPLVTNTLSTTRLLYTNNISLETDRRFYRAQLVP